MADEAKKNRAAQLIVLGALGKKKAPKGDSEPEDADEEEAPESGDVKSMAASDVMAAMKSGDSSAFEDALTRFVRACGHEDY